MLFTVQRDTYGCVTFPRSARRFSHLLGIDDWLYPVAAAADDPASSYGIIGQGGRYADPAVCFPEHRLLGTAGDTAAASPWSLYPDALAAADAHSVRHLATTPRVVRCRTAAQAPQPAAQAPQPAAAAAQAPVGVVVDHRLATWTAMAGPARARAAAALARLRRLRRRLALQRGLLFADHMCIASAQARHDRLGGTTGSSSNGGSGSSTASIAAAYHAGFANRGMPWALFVQAWLHVRLHGPGRFDVLHPAAAAVAAPAGPRLRAQPVQAHDPRGIVHDAQQPHPPNSDLSDPSPLRSRLAEFQAFARGRRESLAATNSSQRRRSEHYGRPVGDGGAQLGQGRIGEAEAALRWQADAQQELRARWRAETIRRATEAEDVIVIDG